MRNHGKSDHHKEHTYPLMADDIVRLLDKLSIPKVTVMGHSMGSKIAYYLACKYPDRVEGVITIDTAPLDFNIHRTSDYDFVRTFQSRLKRLDFEDKYRSQIIKETSRMFISSAVGKMITNNMKFDTKMKSLGWESNVLTILSHHQQMRTYEKLGEYTGHFLSLNSGT